MRGTGLTQSTAIARRLLILILAMSFSIALPGRSPDAADAAPVTVTKVRSRPLVETIPLAGTVTAERNSSLSVRVSGLVASVAVDAGDQVSAGDVLLELDTDLAQLALAGTEASVQEARAQLAEAERLRDEARKLEGSRTIPETQVRATEAEVAIRRAALQRLQAEQREQAERLRRHTLVAPFDGVIASKLTETGEWVDTGTAVLELVETDRLRLDVRAPQKLYQSISEAMPVIVRSEALSRQELEGEVRARVPVNDPAARTFLVRIHIEDPENLLVPGMSAQAYFDIGTGETGIVIPRDAVVRLSDGSTNVWTVKKVDNEMIASRLQVKLGKIMSDRVEVREGLSAGQTIIVRGSEVLSEGQAVRIVESAGEPDGDDPET